MGMLRKDLTHWTMKLELKKIKNELEGKIIK